MIHTLTDNHGQNTTGNSTSALSERELEDASIKKKGVG